ncbi:MAG TPA: tetratricopeptide repeat protein, partial [Burkholderiales bacterium]|nr:tetratricopeptide repeat protein [Burkholderiales bacterium]
MSATAWRGLLTVCLLAAALAGSAGSVMAAEPDVARAQQLLREGKAAEAYTLLEPFEVQMAGDPVFDYLLATAALQSGKPSQATFIYERILSVAPDYAGVRADMARAYYELGDYARARLEFELVLTLQNLPADLRSAVEQYVAAIEQLRKPARTVLRGYTQAGYGRDSNINSTGAGGIITGANGEVIILGPAGTDQADNFWALGFGGEVN